jgi:Zn finger protein HypA/HybF involved in hydrogenase expression
VISTLSKNLWHGGSSSLSTHEVKKILRKIAPTTSLIKEYVSCRVPIHLSCKVCGYQWKTSLGELREGHGCRKCSYKSIGKLLSLSIQEIEKRLKKINPTIKILSRQYQNRKSPLKCECKRCKNLWETSWSSLGVGGGCPRCGRVKMKGSLRLTSLNIKKRLKKINSKIRVVGEYKDSSTPLKCECLVCYRIWSPTWASLSQGCGCPHCSHKAPLNTAEVKRRIKSINSNVEIVGEYQKSKLPLKCRCRQCGHFWSPPWSMLNSGYGCPQCGGNLKSESEVRSIIESTTGSKFPPANPSEIPWLHGLRLDGYDPIHKRAFEYDGSQHKYFHKYFHKSRVDFLRQKRRDWRKNIQCRRHGIQLIRIPYWVKDKESWIKTKLEKLGWAR